MASDSSTRRLQTLLGHLQGSPKDHLALQPTRADSGSRKAECAGKIRRLYTLFPLLLILNFAGSGFQYTLDGCILTAEQRRFYEDQGYLVIRGLVSQADLNKYRDRFLMLCCKEAKVRASCLRIFNTPVCSDCLSRFAAQSRTRAGSGNDADARCDGCEARPGDEGRDGCQQSTALPSEPRPHTFAICGYFSRNSIAMTLERSSLRSAIPFSRSTSACRTSCATWSASLDQTLWPCIRC